MEARARVHASVPTVHQNGSEFVAVHGVVAIFVERAAGGCVVRGCGDVGVVAAGGSRNGCGGRGTVRRGGIRGR